MFIFDFLSERSSSAWLAENTYLLRSHRKTLYHESEYNSTKLFSAVGKRSGNPGKKSGGAFAFLSHAAGGKTPIYRVNRRKTERRCGRNEHEYLNKSFDLR
ncbi:MAG: hypothetical protein ABFD03_01845 [Clostridiaceae bacterium]